MFKKLLGVIFLINVCTIVYAEQFSDNYQFSTTEKREQFYQITKQLRCVVCQNQTLADSDASLAQDLRAEIFQKVETGESEQVIMDFMVSRYGEFVRYSPALTLKTAVLWIGPFLLLALVFLIWLKSARRLSKDK